MDIGTRVRDGIESLANALPGYGAYRAKDARREADKQLRMNLASKYDAQRKRLNDLQTEMLSGTAIMYIDDLEKAVTKLQTFIDRLRTASYGYAGWFDAVKVDDAALNQLYAFDLALADGAEQVEEGVDAVAQSLEDGDDPKEAIRALTKTVADLNTRFDQRKTLLAEGKELPEEDLLEVLGPVSELSPTAKELSKLKLKKNPAITYGGVDYLVKGKITYEIGEVKWYAFLLRDGDEEIWLRVESGGESELATYRAATLQIESPIPEVLSFEGAEFNRTHSGSAPVRVEGEEGRRKGQVEYWLYTSAAGERLWVERWGSDINVSVGQPILADEIRIWAKK